MSLSSTYRNPVTSRITGTPAISVAPMMDWTDRHYRYFARLVSKNALLYTEMVTANACIHGNREYLLGFDDSEHPVALQLGGDDPDAMAEAARIGTDFGYDELNINIGCPSERVQQGNFGACLMAEPRLVARLVEAVRTATHLPVTVKHRIGIRGLESYEDMRRFVDIVAEAEPARFTVHARIAILEGLSPKENRTVPPLRYHDVYRLKEERPNLEIELNGGLKTVSDCVAALSRVDAVMLGRAAYESPSVLGRLDADLFGVSPPTGRAVIEAMADYAERQQERGVAPRHVFRHILHLFSGLPGSRRYRQALSGKIAPDADVRELLDTAIARIPDTVLDAPVGGGASTADDATSPPGVRAAG